MKKNLLLTLLLLLLNVLCFAQTLITTDSTVKIDPSGAKFPLFQKTDPSNQSAKPDTSKRITAWLEIGDGFFTTNPALNWQVFNTQAHPPIVLFTKIYDTNKYPPPTLIKLGKKSTGKGDPSFTYSDMYDHILNKIGVKIVPNTYEIVPGDPMAFALIYKVFEQKDLPQGGVIEAEDTKYKLYFFYNNNRTFTVLDNNNNSFTPSGTSVTLPNARFHNDEVVSFGDGLSNKLIKGDFENSICFTITKNLQDAKAVFISMNPYKDLELGKSGSVYAVLTDSKDNIIGTDIIANMPFSPAHDPNYIVQRPNCLKLPKKAYPFNYKVHFQNTGAGNAVEVKINIQLPRGLNWSTFKIDKASFAGADYTNVLKVGKNVILDTIKNTIIVQFFNDAIAGEIHMLRGTADTTVKRNKDGDVEDITIINAENTTGEILFSIQSTPNTDDNLNAYADIYFKSQYPSGSSVGGYELPVKTNIATTNYKECCTCGPSPLPSLPGCFIILGLCWWWWLLILLGVLLIWYLLGKRKNNKNNKPN